MYESEKERMYIKEFKHTKAKLSSLSGCELCECDCVCGLANHANTYHRIHELGRHFFFRQQFEECFLSSPCILTLVISLPLRLPACLVLL
jgi:hypothetical protein